MFYKKLAAEFYFLALFFPPWHSFSTTFKITNFGYARHGDYCRSISVVGKYAYVGYDIGLSIYDISTQIVSPE
jgi:hypothetical protein